MATGSDTIQRSILPIPDRTQVRLTTYDAKDPNTKFAPIAPLRPPKGAPNVLVVLLDDAVEAEHVRQFRRSQVVYDPWHYLP